MTILKNLILSVAIAPLAIPVAFAIGGNDPIEGIDIIVKRPAVSQANIERPTTVQERSRIMRQTIKPLAQVNPTKAPVKEKHLYHNEKKSECYRRYGNPPTITIGGKTLAVACEVEERRMEIHPSVMLDSNIVNSTTSDPEYSKE